MRAILLLLPVVVAVCAYGQIPIPGDPGASNTNPPVFHDTPYPPRSGPPKKVIRSTIYKQGTNSISFYGDYAMPVLHCDTLTMEGTNWVQVGVGTNEFVHGNPSGFYKVATTNEVWLIPKEN